MILYTLYSPSHERMLNEYLLSSVVGFWISPQKIPQECKTGVYHTEGWVYPVKRKVEMLLKASQVETDPFVYSDCDVILNGLTPEDVIRDLGEDDLACMHNGAGDYCAGFMFIRPCEATVRVFQATLDKITESDQPRLNEVLKTDPIKKRLLPDAVYTNHGLLDLDITKMPSTVKVYHANYIVGIEEKEKALAAAKNIFDEQRLVKVPVTA